MTPLVCLKWAELGRALLDTRDEMKINIIETNNITRGVETCCRKMFDEWLNYDGISWDQLVQALREIGLNYQASEIKKLFKCKTICVIVAIITLASMV